ncbi:MAG: CDP-alcohol phosphatidyltransferase family protein [Rhodanobacteraceae bacterium]|nr:CDP-alcohol phosphatidyltransferase family protein [Rhodanobacteraceae bacterium]
MPESSPSAATNRRPIAARDNALVHQAATLLMRSGLSPNAISVASIGFAAAGAYALLQLPTPWNTWLCAAAAVLRLLCNLLDGLVAVEGGRQTPAGALYNEVPDRIADSLFIVALGMAAGQPWLGWLGALLAALTAYVRTLGGALGLAQDFRGPMAKPHRMWTLVVACLIAPVQLQLLPQANTLLIAAALIAAGSAITCCTRLRAIAAQLEQRA